MLSHLYYSIYFLSFDSLQCLADEEWGDRVTIVSCDMRDWDAPEKADILVSELLGSFGDNELSPECLDGAQKFLKGAHTHLIILVNNLES
jgi:hypothetical protein